MYTLQLSDFLFVELNVGDLFVYNYGNNTFAIREVKQDFRPPLDEFTVEIYSFSTQRHFRFFRDNGCYWWEEAKY